MTRGTPCGFHVPAPGGPITAAFCVQRSTLPRELGVDAVYRVDRDELLIPADGAIGLATMFEASAMLRFCLPLS
jgi:hypothetical protein